MIAFIANRRQTSVLPVISGKVQHGGQSMAGCEMSCNIMLAVRCG